MSRKNICAEIEIERTEFPNFGVGFYNEKKICVQGALPSQRLLVRLNKTRRRIEGAVLEVLKPAPNEISAACPSFGVCGGCTWQNISYEDELLIKKNNVLRLFDAAHITGFEFLGIEPSPSLSAYRNKMEYSFGDNGEGTALCLGMRKKNSRYEVATELDCNLVDEDYRDLVAALLKFFSDSGETFYHKTKHCGSLRNIVIRKGKRTGEIFINIVTTSALAIDLENLAFILQNLKLSGRIVGIYHTINDSVADAIIHQGGELLYGQDYFHDKICGLTFKISPFSFFQTNTAAAEKLYETVLDFAAVKPNANVFDLYCGTGTIAQILAKGAKKVVGIEIVAEAIAAAKENAEMNGLSNCEFITGDVLKELDNLAEKPDCIVLDPPRDGLNPKTVDKLIAFGAESIVYVSCKPTSLLRDLPLFTGGGYRVVKVKLHDLFPRTYHVESVVLLSLV